MTIESFAKKTGWPLEELMQLRWSQFIELISLYDLKMVVSTKRPYVRIK